MGTLSAILRCLLALGLFLAALIIAGIGCYGAWRGIVMFLLLTPQLIIAGFILTMVSIVAAGYLAFLAGIYGLLQYSRAYDDLKGTFWDHPEHDESHKHREGALQTMMWVAVVSIILVAATVPKIREFAQNQIHVVESWRSKSQRYCRARSSCSYSGFGKSLTNRHRQLRGAALPSVSELKRSAKMKYVDPHHKRTDFTATSYVQEAGADGRRIVFSGHGLHASVVLSESGDSVAATVPEFEEKFVLWKIQIMEQQKWLTLDFRAYPTLTRILVHIDELDRRLLEEAIRDLIGERKLLFHCYHE